ncbi:MAG: hypothetical protein ACD_2C00091G0006 [uncultured bacterium (gcode 4)]|uniref:Caib/baif family protein n=1 Tax=uncultured bacterium (gcode 4) TaxID=1234023 RepID=K2H1U6_9BACT|nr:MAG: hypothetical protein ACD_2C00091G0006 [uncultured bacterium (gcode 4)]
MEIVVETKKCRCWSEFDITQWDLDFLEKVSPVFQKRRGVRVEDWEWILDLWDWRFKYIIPAPTLCPDCRQQRRLSFRNERNLYKRKCDATWKSIISNFSPDKPYKVFEQGEWLSDRWSGLDAARDYRYDRSFFSQFDELFKEVPMWVLTLNSENSEYTTYWTNNKNCYLSFCISYCSDCLYSRFIQKSENCIDCLYCVDSKFCYECTDINKCYNLLYSKNCTSCSNSYFLENCISCSDCFGCVSLQNKQYYFYNKPYSREEYLEKVRQTWILNSKGPLSADKETLPSLPLRDLSLNDCENCTWDYLWNSKNCTNCFDWFDAADCKNAFDFWMINDSHDISFAWYDSDLWYELLASEQIHKSIFSSWINVSNIIYSFLCIDSSDLFGCIWLKNAKHCILNKQYTKDEYEALVPKIIKRMREDKEWGEFFPSSISPFWYNETVAMEYYPLTPPPSSLPLGDQRDVARNVSADGKAIFKWSSFENPKPDVSKIIPAAKLPKDITEIPDDILNWAIECEVTWKPFRVIKPELEFYRKNSLPVPKRHPDERYSDRMKSRNQRRLHETKCSKCGIDMITTNSSDKKVYCKECYSIEVI